MPEYVDMRWNFQINTAERYHVVFLGREGTGDVVEKIVYEFMGTFDPTVLPHLTH